MLSLSVSAPDLSPLKRLALLPAGERERRLNLFAAQAGLSVEHFIVRLSSDWSFVGRPKQQPPTGPWTYWLVLAGRGFGKTLTAAQWVKLKAADNPGCRIALVAPTLADVRETMVEGETGLLSILPDSMLRGGERATAWNRSTTELYLANGARLRGFSSETPDRLRGPQHHFAWGEEVSSWEDAAKGDTLNTTFSNLKLGMRLGVYPQACLTSTPKPNKLTKELLTVGGALVVSRGSSYENRDNLSEAWWETVVAPYEGTRLGRQEIHAEVLEDVEGALWRQAQLDERRVKEAPQLERIVVAVDPNASSDSAANDAGIIVAGRDSGAGLHSRAFVLADLTVTSGGPRAWAKAAVDAYHQFRADRIIAEKNNGGEMVEITIHTVDASVPVKLVTASRGKRVRAEPVAALYESSELNPLGRVLHVGVFPELEEQMTTWVPGAESPDRFDALAWAMTELMLGSRGGITGVARAKGHIPSISERIALDGLLGGLDGH